MGVVHVATDTHLGREVALKVVSGRFATSPEFRARFQREADTLTRLDSPHVIAIYDHGEEDGVPWLATQYVRGGDLGDLLQRRGALAPGSAIEVCAQLAEALADAHRAGVVHRDVKPSNVLVRDPEAERLHVYLCDFGIALDASSDRLTTAGEVVGTWAFLAPERTQGATATPASDLYSLGCLLWTCLTGSAPYGGADVSVAIAHVNAPVRQLAGTDPLSRHLNEVLRTALAKDPAQRYATASDLRRALLAAPPATAPLAPLPIPQAGAASAPPTVARSTDDEVSRPSPPAPSPPAARPARRSAARPAAVAAVVLAVVLVAVSLVLLAGRDDDGSTADGGDPTRAAPRGPGPVTGDVTGDGLGDAVAYHEDGGSASRFVLASDGTRFDVGRERLEDFEFPVYLDLDGDATLDRVEPVPGSDGALTLRSSVADLDGRRLDGIALPDAFLFVDTLAGDFDGDGADDLLVWGQTGSLEVTVWVVRGGGAGDLGDPEVWLRLDGQHTDTTNLRAGDVDGDGATDLLAVLPDGTPAVEGPSASWDGARGLRLYRSEGDSFAAAGALQVLNELVESVIAVGDFTGDGPPLVAIPRAESRQVLVVEVDADGRAARREDLDVDLPDDGPDPEALRLVVSDVDGDRADDLVLVEKTSERTFGPVLVALSTGSGFEAPRSWATAPPRCRGELPCVYAWMLTT